MHVPVDDGDAVDPMPGTEVAGGDGDVVEEAEAHGLVPLGVVSGRPVQAEGVGGGAGGDGIGGG